MENIETYRGEEYNYKKPHLTSILNKNNNPYLTKKKAFTLAEVLITLAIIGIVAALTIPSVITNYQKKQYVTQLKKEYSNLSSGLKTIMATDGVTSFGDTKLISEIEGDDTSSGDQLDFLQEFSKTFKVIKHYKVGDLVDGHLDYVKYSYLGGKSATDFSTKRSSIFLADGSILYYEFYKKDWNDNSDEDIINIKVAGGKLTRIFGELTIDVNGTKGPNKWGKDLFIFAVGQDGALYPNCGKEFAIYYAKGQGYSEYWKDEVNACGTEGSSAISSNTWGDGCAARIMEEGWEMKY